MFKLAIKTSQNIPLFFNPASISQRLLAFLVDNIIISGYITFLIFIIRIFKLHEYITNFDVWSLSAIFSIILAPVALYKPVCESFMEGQTFGKKLIKIKIIKINGYNASFLDFIIRWFLGFFEIYFLPFVSIISIIISKYNQRLGDYASGCAVISLKNTTNISHSILVEVEEEYTPYFTYNQIIMFSDNDVQIIKNYYDLAVKKNQWKTFERLYEKIESISGKKAENITNIEYINRFLKDYSFHTSKK